MRDFCFEEKRKKQAYRWSHDDLINDIYRLFIVDDRVEERQCRRERATLPILFAKQRMEQEDENENERRLIKEKKKLIYKTNNNKHKLEIQ